jgi:3-sulfinopropanoyl-CoA desulfinase
VSLPRASARARHQFGQPIAEFQGLQWMLADLQIHGAQGSSRNLPLKRHVRDARMLTIAGGTAQTLRTQVAASVLGIKTPQTRDGYLWAAPAAE